MAKDPAVLFYIANWLTSTADMDADCRGWYLNLLLHHYDKGGLPNDVEKLAQLASVRFSEFERFKQVLEQVLNKKFVLNEETGLLENKKIMETLQSREVFKDKRQRSGNIGVVIKLANTITGFNKKYILSLKEQLYLMTDKEIEEAKSEQVLKQMLKLYINTNTDINTINNKSKDVIISKAKTSFENNSCEFKSSEFKRAWIELLSSDKWLKKKQTAIDKSLKQIMKYDEDFSLVLVERAIAGEYQGLTFSNTDNDYKNYLNSKNGKRQQSSTSKAQSRDSLKNLAIQILSSEDTP